MNFFSAYGYSLASEVDLPGFATIAQGKTDISILYNTNHLAKPASQLNRTLSLHKTLRGHRINWPGVGSYEIIEGKKIVVTPEPNLGSRANLVVQPLYGIALATILLQNNHLVLHGSTVEISGNALTILGNKGFGKSTLTACLLSNGHNFLTDDITALLSCGRPDFLSLPGVPRLKLWSDAVRAIGINPDTLPYVAPSIPKHIYYIPSRQYKNQNTLLHTIIILDYGDSIALHKMSQSEKMVSLLGGQYFAKFHHALDEKTHKLIFQQCSELARNVTIVKLVMPRNVDSLPVLANMLEQLVDG